MTSLISAFVRSSGGSPVTTTSSLTPPGSSSKSIAERLPEPQRQSGMNGASEAGQVRRDLVGAGPQRWQEIASFAVRDALDAGATVEVLGDNRHTGQNAALRIADNARNFARVGLRGSRTHHHDQDDHRQHQTHEPKHFSSDREVHWRVAFVPGGDP